MHQCREEESGAFPEGLGNWGRYLEMARERESVELGAKLCGTQPVLSGRWGEGPGPGVPRKVPEIFKGT